MQLSLGQMVRHHFAAVVVACYLWIASAKDADAQDSFNDKYLMSYLPPGDEHYTDSWVGENSSWRSYMSQYSGKSGDYQKYLKQYGGPQANYDQYVSLYASMAGADVTSGKDYNSKGKSQLDAWNKSMVTTYNLYIPGPYENFAEQATEERTGNGGQGVGKGTMGEGQGGSSGAGGGGQPQGSGSGGMPWIPSGGGGGEKETEGGGGGNEVGYEPFARPWVVQYATDEGGNNAFDYEGKEFASGGMQMGGVQDYADYMNQYAGEWVPEESIDQKHQADGHKDAEQKGGDQKGRHQKDRHPKTGHEKADHQQGGHQKAHHQKEDHHQDSDEQNSKASAAVPGPDKTHMAHAKGQKEGQKAVQKASEKDHKHTKDKKAAQAVTLLDTSEEWAPVPHPAQPVLPRLKIASKDFKSSTDILHPAQPVLPQLSKASKEAIEDVRSGVQRLQQAAQDEVYAAWTMNKHLPAQEQTHEQKQLGESMSRLWKVTREPLNTKSLQELEDAGRAASTAITRLRTAELQQLRKSAKTAQEKLMKGAKDWSEMLQRDARKQDSKKLVEEARQAGVELERSLTKALESRTENRAQELLLRAQQRKKLLQGVLSEAVDVAKMARAPQFTVEETKPQKETLEVKVEETILPERQTKTFTAEKLKGVSGSWLLLGITIAGLLYSVAGFVLRRSAAAPRESREIALLTIAEP